MHFQQYKWPQGVTTGSIAESRQMLHSNILLAPISADSGFFFGPELYCLLGTWFSSRVLLIRGF
jgi:hypothetical protein